MPSAGQTSRHAARDMASRIVLRHRWPLRWMHWINLACLLVLIGSGLQIFNAHPALYWGETSRFDAPLLAITAEQGPDGKGRGIIRIGDARWDTTGLLGVSRRGVDGRNVRRGFPEWATVPGPRSLALGRRWHFFFGWLWVINGACYLAWSLASRHLQRDLAMHRGDWRALPGSLADHLRLRQHAGDALRYNPLQRLAYLGVIFVLAPLAIVTGLSMSPQLDSVMAGFIELVGGRQSARTLHFVAMSALVLFAVVHVLMVVYAGFFSRMRAMITGRVRVQAGVADE